MYRINPLMRDVLIMTDEVIFHAPTKQTLDPRTIQNSIIIAEERFIRPGVGDEFYDRLLEAKNKTVTTDNKVELETAINGSLPAGYNPVTLAVGDIVNAAEFLEEGDLKLWRQHLWKLSAECVLLLAMPEGFVQFGSEGVIHTSPVASPLNTTGVSTPELKSVRWMMDKKMMDRIDPLLEAMHNWICKRNTTYPYYCKPCDCDSNGVAYKRKTDWVTGLYPEDDHNCGCHD